MNKISITIYSIFAITVTFFITACGGENKEQNEEDVWVAPEKTDTIAMLPAVDMPDDTITVSGNLYHFSYLLAPDDSLPVIRSYTEQRYYDNAVDLKVTDNGKTVFKKHFTKNSFNECVPTNELKKLSLVGFNYYQAKRNDSSKFFFVAMIGDPDDNDENFYFVEIQIDNNGNMKIKKAKTEDFFTMPLDYDEE